MYAPLFHTLLPFLSFLAIEISKWTGAVADTDSELSRYTRNKLYQMWTVMNCLLDLVPPMASPSKTQLSLLSKVFRNVLPRWCCDYWWPLQWTGRDRNKQTKAQRQFKQPKFLHQLTDLQFILPLSHCIVVLVIILTDVCLDKCKLSNKPKISLIGDCGDEDAKSNRWLRRQCRNSYERWQISVYTLCFFLFCIWR